MWRGKFVLATQGYSSKFKVTKKGSNYKTFTWMGEYSLLTMHFFLIVSINLFGEFLSQQRCIYKLCVFSNNLEIWKRHSKPFDLIHKLLHLRAASGSIVWEALQVKNARKRETQVSPYKTFSLQEKGIIEDFSSLAPIIKKGRKKENREQRNSFLLYTKHWNIKRNKMSN